MNKMVQLTFIHVLTLLPILLGHQVMLVSARSTDDYEYGILKRILRRLEEAKESALDRSEDEISLLSSKNTTIKFNHISVHVQ